MVSTHCPADGLLVGAEVFRSYLWQTPIFLSYTGSWATLTNWATQLRLSGLYLGCLPNKYFGTWENYLQCWKLSEWRVLFRECVFHYSVTTFVWVPDLKKVCDSGATMNEISIHSYNSRKVEFFKKMTIWKMRGIFLTECDCQRWRTYGISSQIQNL